MTMTMNTKTENPAPDAELAALVLEMMGVSERGNPDFISLISHRLFSPEKWERMAELAREINSVKAGKGEEEKPPRLPEKAPPKWGKEDVDSVKAGEIEGCPSCGNANPALIENNGEYLKCSSVGELPCGRQWLPGWAPNARVTGKTDQG